MRGRQVKRSEQVNRRVWTWGALLVLALAFLAFGLWVHSQVPVPIGTDRDTEIYSFDYLGYANTFTDFRCIGYGRFRHPLWGWLLSPLTLFGQRLYAIDEQAYWVFMLSFFAVVAALAVLLLYRLLRRVDGISRGEALAATALFLSFAHVWLLGGMPETYGISMLLALATLHWAVGSGRRIAAEEFRMMGEKVAAPRLGLKIDTVGWAVLAVLTGGITITQAVKTLVAFFVVRRPSWRRGLAICGGLALALAGVAGVFALRVWLRTRADASAPGFASAWHTLVDNFTGGDVSVLERLRYVWVFFSEPLLLRGENFDARRITGGYGSILQPALLAFLYAMVAASAWLNRRRMLVKVMASMFAVDAAIHFVAEWGLTESQLYAGHWFYTLPIFVGLLFPGLTIRRRRCLVIATWALAAAFLVLNLHGYFGHDVGIAWPPAGGEA